MLSLLLLLACSTGSDADPAAAPTDPAAVQGTRHDAPRPDGAPPTRADAPGDHAEHGKHGRHGKHGAQGDDATVTHRFDNAEEWVEVFDDPARMDWQLPAELVGELDLQAGMVVADIGAGTGYFNRFLAGGVGTTGKVIAIDIEPSMVAHMTKRAQDEQTPQVEARLGQAADPGLAPAEADLVLMVDTYHHIDGRVEYFRRLRDGVKPNGRLVIVDFKPGDIPIGPPEEHRIAQAQVVKELTDAGWFEGQSIELLPYQFVQVMHRDPLLDTPAPTDGG